MNSIINASNLNKTIRYLKKNGILAAYYAAKERMELRASEPYSYINVDEKELQRQKEEITKKSQGDKTNFPTITIVMPTFETSKVFFLDAVESVIAQSYPYWELIIADASYSENVKVYYEELYTKEERIKYINLENNLGISDNTNEGIKYAEGDYIALLDHDDILTPDALYHMARAIIDNASDIAPAIVYSDEDKYDSDLNLYFNPNIKYEFNYDYILTNNYICHLMLIKKEYFDEIKLRKEYDGAQDFDLILQIIEHLINIENVQIAKLGDYIIHVPKILYHWRCHEQSTAANTASKGYAYESGLRAVKNHLLECGHKDIKVTHSKHLGFYDINWDLTKKSNTSEAIFKERSEIFAVIPRVLDKNKRMREVLFDKQGKALYAGINKHYSGTLNRFDLAQNIFAGDIRFLEINPVYLQEFKSFLASCGETFADYTNLNDVDAKTVSMKLGEYLDDKGLLLYYNPKAERKAHV